MRSLYLAVAAAALACPIGASAADMSAGAGADRARAVDWNSTRSTGGTDGAAANRLQEPPLQLAARETQAVHAAGWSDHVYRYGRHEPDLEELPGRLSSDER